MKIYVITALIALTLLFSAAAQDSGYELTGYVVASGSSIDGGDYAMSGALGQTETGTLNGGDYAIGSGFFGGGVIKEERGISICRRCSDDDVLRSDNCG
jgi:type 1 fimbria pilin